MGQQRTQACSQREGSSCCRSPLVCSSACLLVTREGQQCRDDDSTLPSPFICTPSARNQFPLSPSAGLSPSGAPPDGAAEVSPCLRCNNKGPVCGQQFSSTTFWPEGEICILHDMRRLLSITGRSLARVCAQIKMDHNKQQAAERRERKCVRIKGKRILCMSTSQLAERRAKLQWQYCSPWPVELVSF